MLQPHKHQKNSVLKCIHKILVELNSIFSWFTLQWFWLFVLVSICFCIWTYFCTCSYCFVIYYVLMRFCCRPWRFFQRQEVPLSCFSYNDLCLVYWSYLSEVFKRWSKFIIFKKYYLIFAWSWSQRLQRKKSLTLLVSILLLQR